MSIEGRMFPVDIHYLQDPCTEYLKRSFDAIINIHRTEPPGDILVFLTGQDEIDELVQWLDETETKIPLLPLPLYGGLSMEQQLKAFAPSPRGVRKVVISTNIAEASVTIDGVVYVIDCGFVKVYLSDVL